MQGGAILSKLLNLFLEGVNLMLVGHEERLNVIEFLEVVVGVDGVVIVEGGVLGIEGDGWLQGRELLGEFLV